MKKLLILLLLLPLGLTAAAQSPYTTNVKALPTEKWWGGFVGLGSHMPYASNFPAQNMAGNNYNNQVAPLLLSSQGRYIWSEHPFRFEIVNDTLRLSSDYEPLSPIQAGKTLREAYLTASAKHFPPSGQIPEELFFSMPQYNTWIELIYNQNRQDIMKYAHKVVEHGYPKGVFMIDDNWQRYYGNFDFKEERFGNAREMVDSLHQIGFRVMLWVAPYISADSPEFRELESKGYLLRKPDGQTAIIHWWNGYSACYDTTNPEAMAYLTEQLRENQRKYGTDGFKFDGADVGYMQGVEASFCDSTANFNTYMQRWAELGKAFPYNELRACWKLGGEAIVQRLGDKNYAWDALQALIPEMATAGLLGYPYTCPDMIGGGGFGSFLGVDKFDEELIVRSAQLHALMPMMQFSVAPWRILSPENNARCAQAAQLHQQFAPYILSLAKEASRTGEPIVRSMEYQYPHAGFAECRDQFMLGDRYLMAPLTTPGGKRTVTLPAGVWKDDLGKRFKGPRTIQVEASLDRTPYYERLR